MATLARRGGGVLVHARALCGAASTRSGGLSHRALLAAPRVCTPLPLVGRRSVTFSLGPFRSLLNLPTTIVQHRLAQQVEARKLMLRWQNPILKSAHHFQRTLYHIVLKGGLVAPVEPVPLFPAYQIACFFAWYELMRVNLVFLEQGSQQTNRNLADAFENITSTVSAISMEGYTTLESAPVPSAYRMSVGQIRCLCEALIVDAENPAKYLDLVASFAAFEKACESSSSARWKEALLDITMLRKGNSPSDLRRLVRLQHRLLELMDILDPTCQSIPKDKRRPLHDGQELPAAS